MVGKHACYKGLELDIAMIQVGGDRTTELHLYSLEAEKVSGLRSKAQSDSLILVVRLAILAFFTVFCASESSYHRREMSAPREWGDSVCAAAFVARGLPKVLDADNDVAAHLGIFIEECSTSSETVSSPAAHALLYLKLLLFEALPIVVDAGYINMDIAQPIIVVSGILVV